MHTKIITVQVTPETEKSFVDWQKELSQELSAFPGFLSLEILSSKDAKTWTIHEQFSTEDEAKKWTRSQAYLGLRKKLEAIVGADAIHEDVGDLKDTGVTEVFVTYIDPTTKKKYREWIAKIHQVEANFPGFRGMHVQAPTEENQNKWITYLQFDSVENLERWLNSEERKAILEEAGPMIRSLESHRMMTPFAGWFQTVQVPNVVKQTMLVLLVLFPIVMLEFKYLNPLTASLSTSVATFIGNAVSVSLIALIVPWVAWMLGWWLAPKNTQKNLLGYLLILVLYLISILIFL